MPVPHPDVDRQRPVALREPVPQAIGLSQRELGERGDPVEQFVVMRDFLDPFRRDPATAQHVAEERANVVAPLRPAEGDDQDGIEWVLHNY